MIPVEGNERKTKRFNVRPRGVFLSHGKCFEEIEQLAKSDIFVGLTIMEIFIGGVYKLREFAQNLSVDLGNWGH